MIVLSHKNIPDMSPNVAEAFGTFPKEVLGRLLELRTLIFNVAASTDGVGKLFEDLRWGQLAYLTPFCHSGSTIRLGWESGSNNCAMYFICTTSLVEEFRQMFPEALNYSKNRAILISPGQELPHDPLGICIARALTYHQKNTETNFDHAGSLDGFKPVHSAGRAVRCDIRIRQTAQPS